LIIIVLVVLCTGFPTAYASVASTLYVPLTIAVIGIMLRGAGFAFRKAVTELELERAFGATFAISSVVTPFFLGTVAGAVASGRVPVGNASGDALASWWNPTSILGGTLAVGTCAFLAATFLCVDAERNAPDLLEGFRRRALGAGIACGLIALVGIGVLHADAPILFHGLTHRGLPLVVLSAIAGGMTLVLLTRHRHRHARITAVAAVVAVVWGWAAGQYPVILEPDITIEQAAGGHDTLVAMTVAIVIGAVVLGPSLYLLLRLQQGDLSPRARPTTDRRS
jgi:cytochrome d ubiquinol oxidase subunit II